MPHINKLYDFVVTIYIVYEGKVLLVYHPKYKRWMPIGGHIELDEDPEEALMREIKEECGLEVEILSEKPAVTSPGFKCILTPNYVDVHDANPPHKHISFTYFARAKSGNFLKSKEHSVMCWVSLKRLDSGDHGLPAVMEFYCREAIARAQQ